MVFFASLEFDEQADKKAKLHERKTGTRNGGDRANRFQQTLLLLAYAQLHRLF